MNSTISDIALCDDRLIKITGPVACGKTQALLERCLYLLQHDVSPARILVSTTSSFAAHAFKKRLCECAGSDAALAEKTRAVSVYSTQDAIIHTLAKPEVSAQTKRRARLLCPFEYNFVLEDMKTLGQPRRELRAMLRYFYRNWANFTPDEEWLYGDTVSVCGKLQDICQALGGISEFEASYVCAKFLKSDEGSAFRGAYDYVFCDDFQNASRATQTALCLHAKKQLVVAGDIHQWSKQETSWPYVDGFAKFEQLRHGVHVFELHHANGNACIQRLAHSLSGATEKPSFDADGTPTCRIKWTLPEDEVVGITKVLREQFNTDSALHERDFCIIVPNKRFARSYQKALGARGFQTSLAGLGCRISGDPRTSNSAPTLVSYIKLNLAAHETDAVAWRAWCGLDDALCNSQAFEGLYAYAKAHDKPLVECLQEISRNVLSGKPEPFPRAGVLAKRYEQGKKLINDVQKRRGFNVFGALGANSLPEFAEIEDALSGTETAREVFSLMRESVFSPHFSDDVHCINIANYNALAGVNFKNIIDVGMIDGYMPGREAFEVVSTEDNRNAFKKCEQRTLYCALGKARESLVLSYFTKCDLELAERTKAHVSRIRSEEGARMAFVRPSCFFTAMEDECPHTISGQAYLAQRNLN